MKLNHFLGRVRSTARSLFDTTLSRFELVSVSKLDLITFQQAALQSNYLKLINELPTINLEINSRLALKAKSQLGQELFVLSELSFLRNGFFVEFGATNGVDLSNTYVLEKEYGWQGILAEPALIWHDNLNLNRSVSIDVNCVWKTSGETLVFNETKYPELSTIEDFNASDLHKKSRDYGKKYKVSTISLLDLLQKYEAPKIIDYLSLDTEGSELDILEAFDFNQYRIKIITVEHNYTPNRRKIHDLLTAHGYVRKYENLSHFDDWYVLAKS